MRNKEILVLVSCICLLLSGCGAIAPVSILIIEEHHRIEQEEARKREEAIEEALAKEAEEKRVAEEKENVTKVAECVLDALICGDTDYIKEQTTESGTVTAILKEKENIDFYEDDEETREGIFRHITKVVYKNILEGYEIESAEIAENKASVTIKAKGIKDFSKIEREINGQDIYQEWENKCVESYYLKGLYTVEEQQEEAVEVLKGIYTEKLSTIDKENWKGTVTLTKEDDMWKVDSLINEEGYAIVVSL